MHVQHFGQRHQRRKQQLDIGNRLAIKCHHLAAGISTWNSPQRALGRAALGRLNLHLRELVVRFQDGNRIIPVGLTNSDVIPAGGRAGFTSNQTVIRQHLVVQQAVYQPDQFLRVFTLDKLCQNRQCRATTIINIAVNLNRTFGAIAHTYANRRRTGHT